MIVARVNSKKTVKGGKASSLLRVNEKPLSRGSSSLSKGKKVSKLPYTGGAKVSKSPYKGGAKKKYV